MHDACASFLRHHGRLWLRQLGVSGSILLIKEWPTWNAAGGKAPIVLAFFFVPIAQSPVLRPDVPTISLFGDR